MTSNASNYNDPLDPLHCLFSGGGAYAFKFNNPGDQVIGTIIDLEIRPQTDYGSGAP